MTPRDGANDWDRAYDDGRVGLRCAVCHLQLAACICPSRNVATATPASLRTGKTLRDIRVAVHGFNTPRLILKP